MIITIFLDGHVFLYYCEFLSYSNFLCHSLGKIHQQEVDDDGRNKTCQGIDEIMCLDVNGSHAEEHIEWQEDIYQLAISCMPCHQYADGADSDVRTWECCRWSFACSLGILYQMIEYTVGVAWRRQTVGMGVEIIAHGWEYSLGDFAYATASK